MNTPAPINHAAPYRGPIEAVRICLRKYVDLDGRASRSEFWWFALFILLCEVCMIAMRLMWEDWRSYMPSGMSEFIVFAAFVLPATAVGARRLHDTGRGDWRLLFFFLPAAMLISTFVSPDEILPDAIQTPAVFMGALVFGYGMAIDLILLIYVLPPIHRITFFDHGWMVAVIYIPLAMFAYSWAKEDKAAQNGFYFDGLPVYKKLLIAMVLVVLVLYCILILASVSDSMVLLAFLIPMLIPVVIFTYWWIQQGNPAANKYDHAKTLPRKKWLIAGLPMAVVIYTAILLLLHILLVGN